MRVKLAAMCSITVFIFLYLYMAPRPLYRSTEQALQDLAFIVNQVVNNHPGMYNIEDAHFAQNLYQYTNIARAQLLDSSTRPADCKKIINTFTQSFNDAHLRIEWNTGGKKKILKDSRSFSITEVAPKVWWITLPTFQDLNEKQQSELAQLKSQLSKIRNSRAIIFDIRGNRGGNSDIGRAIVSSLFGENYTSYRVCLTKQSQAIDWRAPEILAHVQWLRKHIAQPNEHQKYDDIAQGIDKSIKHKNPFYREKKKITALDHVEKKHTVEAQIACIIHGENGSAALNFIDDLMAMQHPITLIGQTTNADRLYMELRMIDLPSNNGEFCHPVKVYRNRPRKDNQPYQPTLVFKGNINDTDALRKFVLNAYDIPQSDSAQLLHRQW